MIGMRARIIPEEDLESLEGAEWVDRTKRPFVEGGTAYVPVKEGYPFTTTLPARTSYSGRGYYMLGSVAVLQGERPSHEEIQSILEWKNPQGVLWVEGCHGIERTPRTEVLAGTVPEVFHRESGITYMLDPTRIMFSMGNRGEKERIRGLVRPEERVADMYAGIGYFTLPVARAGARVHAMEINPDAFSYLVRNIRMNNVGHLATAELGDCRDLLTGTYDRIIMGHFSSMDRLPDALSHAGPGTTLHVHSVGIAAKTIESVLESLGVRASITTHKVKKVSAHTWHYVQDVTVE